MGPSFTVRMSLNAEKTQFGNKSDDILCDESVLDDYQYVALFAHASRVSSC